ncbi:MAG: type II toxin-antitoxin system HicB family antitoxin [Candidatus Omnitrophica bacterium]|nr:type II toxin-antitoxin system HicB family antitoxin [Candidatus Omnitrophota bacterium]MCA9430260.1 type II toxin-antitoxin system HicB family antitoxin [Candidatus Omnitrophota bacterium]MCA9439573.1 type II toxin-antitoxin system HicB family antitoxin [Candidatus Omnitrophota bacterium]
MTNLTPVLVQFAEGFVGYVEELPGANIQGATVEECRENLSEAIALVLGAHEELKDQR